MLEAETPSEIPSYLILLEWMTEHNRRLIAHARAIGRPFPRIYDAARYLAEPDGWEEFAAAAIVAKRKHGDCDDLAPYLAGQYRAEGRDAEVALIWKPKPSGKGRHIHAIVRVDRELEDPSERLGMVA